MKLVVVQSHFGHTDAGTQIHRDHAGEGVVVQVEPPQVAEATEALGDLPVEPVEAQVECRQEGEVPKGWGECSCEPGAVQAQSHHPCRPPMPACHAFPTAEVSAAVPGGQRAAITDLRFESKQGALVTSAHDGDHQDGEKWPYQAHDPHQHAFLGFLESSQGSADQ